MRQRHERKCVEYKRLEKAEDEGEREAERKEDEEEKDEKVNE